MVLLEIGMLLALGAWVYYTLMQSTPITKPGGVEVSVQLTGASDKAVLYQAADGTHRYIITEHPGNRQVDLSSEELAARTHGDRSARTWSQKILNVSDPFGYLWVGLGFLGQILFTGRMVVQWLVSERRGESVVPPIFWWMSLIGASMLMAYFMWRRDPIGLLGQAFGWFIYVRNLWMIYRPQAPHTDAIIEAEAKEAAV
jgi:lipid-A-disaccharide synthase-like uncharacterized protein